MNYQTIPTEELLELEASNRGELNRERATYFELIFRQCAIEAELTQRGLDNQDTPA